MFVDSKISRIFASLLRNKAFNDDSGCSAVRLAHLLWEQGVPGSNPGIPTRKELQKCNSFFCLATDSRVNLMNAHTKKTVLIRVIRA